MTASTGGTGIMQRFAVLTAAMTVLLILAGGFVTTTATGDSIPGWPLMWGRLSAGFPIEWTHRAIAMVVASMVGALAIWAGVTGQRPAVRGFAALAFAGILVQAAIGGLRIFVPRAAVAIVHACFAQVVFCAVTGVALILSRAWSEARLDPEAAAARRLGMLTVIFAFLQLVAGAVTRHTGAGLVVHFAGAGLVLLHATLFASRLASTTLQRGALTLAGLLMAQLILGFVSWAIRSNGFVRTHEGPLAPAVIITSHVAVGALVLAAALVLTLRCFRAAAPRVELSAVTA